MAVKCTGAEFKRFYNDPQYWVSPETSGGDHTWHDDGAFYINGVEQPDGIESEKLLDADEVKIEGGVVFGPVVGTQEPSFEAYFKRWKKAQTTAIFAVECDLEKLDAVKQAIAAAGGKLVA